ncbi:MAG: nucleotidyltransferase domain-containing protein, partial [Thermoproteota archaeon]
YYRTLLYPMFDKIAFQILLFLQGGPARFKDLKNVVKNSRTLALKLRMLTRSGLVREVGSGYVLNEKGMHVSSILMELNSVLNSPIFSIKNVERIPHSYLAPVVRKYCEALKSILGERLVSIMLFGSVARGDWDRSSDMDTLVVAEGWDNVPVWSRVEELNSAKRKLEGTVEYSEALKAGYWPIIQNYPLSVDEAKKFNRIYLDSVIEGIILYDKKGFLDSVLQSLRKTLEEMGSVRITLPSGKYYWVLKDDIKAGEVIVLE